MDDCQIKKAKRRSNLELVLKRTTDLLLWWNSPEHLERMQLYFLCLQLPQSGYAVLLISSSLTHTHDRVHLQIITLSLFQLSNIPSPQYTLFLPVGTVAQSITSRINKRKHLRVVVVLLLH